jgi:hypothetical protein
MGQEGDRMAVPAHQTSSPLAGSGYAQLVPALSRRLAAAGMGVQVTRRRDACELAITGTPGGKSLVALEASGQARWYYEPATGASTSPATLTVIIAWLLGEPPIAPSPAPCQALPLKGQVGRALQDQGLTVTLRVSEDWESFEATTDIDITSPARPWLGTITMSDDAALDWHCNWQAAFGENLTAFIDLLIPVLRPR